MENVRLEIIETAVTVRAGEFEKDRIVVDIYHFKNGDFTEYSQKAKELAEKIVELLKEMEL